MDKRKTSVMKSFSTSEAKNSGVQEHNKKSRSSAEFQAKITVTGGFQPLKRRGVYVEKKTIKIPIHIAGPDERVSPQRIQPRRIRRPDKKRFLANVLTLLSKSTAATQCSASNSIDQLIKLDKTTQKLKKKKEEVIIDEPTRSTHTPVTSLATKRKPRYKPRSLNNHVDGEIDSLIVLQSTKQIVQTPSNNSESVSTLNKKAVSTHIELDVMDWAAPIPPPDRQDLDTTPARPSLSKQLCISNKEEMGLEDKRNEKNIYNFFVDVLKTTLSACNVTQESDEQPLCTNLSNVSLVIDEVVAEKLNMKKMKEPEPVAPYKEPLMSYCNSTCFYSVQEETQEWGDNFKPEFSKQYKVELSKRKKKQRMISNSFEYRKAIPATTRPVPKTKSLLIPPKKTPMKTKPNNKRDFIESIKQELKFDTGDVYEKPNFYEALKTIARNKKKQSVNFQTYRKPRDDYVCTLRNRKVLSAKSSSKNQSKNPDRLHFEVLPNTHQTNFSGYDNRKYAITIYETSSEESMHSNYSLEVIGYDEKPKVNIQLPQYPWYSELEKLSSPTLTLVAVDSICNA